MHPVAFEGREGRSDCRPAARQFNRVSRHQLLSIGLNERTIERRVASHRLFVDEQGAFSLSPVLAGDEWGRWMGGNTDRSSSFLSEESAAAASGLWDLPRRFECITRPGSGYSGLPLGRARSGAEIRALEILRAAARPLPRLNVRVAGEEADLSWPGLRLIIEIDGTFHLDVGEEARKDAAWSAAGWTVRCGWSLEVP